MLGDFPAPDLPAEVGHEQVAWIAGGERQRELLQRPGEHDLRPDWRQCLAGAEAHFNGFVEDDSTQ
jgi:hypothetical protein